MPAPVCFTIYKNGFEVNKKLMRGGGMGKKGELELFQQLCEIGNGVYCVFWSRLGRLRLGQVNLVGPDQLDRCYRQFIGCNEVFFGIIGDTGGFLGVGLEIFEDQFKSLWVRFPVFSTQFFCANDAFEKFFQAQSVNF